jgi:hypothetical protein
LLPSDRAEGFQQRDLDFHLLEGGIQRQIPGRKKKGITICSIKKKLKLYFTVFLAREQKNSGKKLFFFYRT